MGVQGNLVRDQSPEREVGGQCNSMAAGVYFWALGPPSLESEPLLWGDPGWKLLSWGQGFVGVCEQR